jgi:hypothetical protein
MNPSTTPEPIPDVKQEIKDLFAQNSGNYDPTCQEVEAVDAGLDNILDGLLNELRAHRESEARTMKIAKDHLDWHAQNVKEAYESYE